MGWDRIIGQERAQTMLIRALERDRVAHAYLFHGPDGTGKRAVALAFAQALQCEGDPRPCGGCAPCRKVAALIHPDVHVLLPQPSDATAGDVRERIVRLAENPYATVDFSRRPSLDDPGRQSGKQVQYSVAAVNAELRREMSFRPVEGRYKVAVLTDAELLRKEAANAFLKLLEEPGQQTVFILCTARPDRMLSTIRSRCQSVRFDRLTADQIAPALRAAIPLPEATTRAIARMADGSFGRALDLAASDDLDAARESVLDFMRASYQVWSHADRMADLVEKLSRQSRDQVKFMLELMLGWVRDLLLLRTTGSDAMVVNADQATALTRFNGNIPGAQLEAMSSQIEDAIHLIDRNVQVRLVLTVLAQQQEAAMHGNADHRLLLPLTEAW